MLGIRCGIILALITFRIGCQPYPLSSTNNASQNRSLRLSNLLPRSELGSTSGKPSISNAFLAVMKSDCALPSDIPARESLGDGMMSLLREMSTAIVRADDIYEQVSSSDQCLPGAIHGTFTMNANTISGDRFRLALTFRARILQ